MNAARRPADPDRILVAKLIGTAQRLAAAGGRMDDAVAELRELAAGRGDLLAEAAGVTGGYWSAVADTKTGDNVTAIGLLMSAGADYDLIARWVDIGRGRAQAERHGI